MKNKVLKDFLTLPGVSGKEDKIVNYIKNNSSNLSYQRDNLGSLHFYFESKNKNAKTVLIDAHIDEVGFVITELKSNGLIAFEALGGFFYPAIFNSKVEVWNSKNKKFNGYIINPQFVSHGGNLSNVGSKTLKDFEPEDFLIDIGAKDKKQLEKNNIKVGDQIVFSSEIIKNFNTVISKAVDNRLGTYLCFKLLDFIKNANFEYNIIVNFSTQEEVGLRGVRPVVYKYNPDLAIVVDISPANDVGGYGEPKGILGKGPFLRHKDALTLYSRKIINFLENDILIKYKIPYQNYESSGGTNAGIIQMIKDGCGVIPVGLVARNLHTGYSIFNLLDLEYTESFLKKILENLDNEKIENLKTNY